MVNHVRVHEDDEPLLPLMDHNSGHSKVSGDVRLTDISHQHADTSKSGKLSGSTVHDSVSSLSSPSSSEPEERKHHDHHHHFHSHTSHALDKRTSLSPDDDHERQQLHIPHEEEDSEEDEPVSLEALKESEKDKRRLKIAIGLCSTFFIVELLGGLWTESLALLSDSYHLLTDITSFIISLAAIYLSHRPPTATHTFGYHRAEVLGALFSIFLIWALTFLLVVEAYNRVRHPIDVDGKTMSIIAGLGVFVNIILMFVLGGHHHHHGDDDHEHGHGHRHGHTHQDHERLQTDDHDHDHISSHKPAIVHDHNHGHGHGHGHHHHHHVNLNITAATLHVLGDLLSSIGVLISSIVITFYPSLTYLDPVCTFVFSVLVIATTVGVFKRSVSILMERVPQNMNSEEIKEAICDIPGVLDVESLHVWSLTIGQAALAGTIYLQPEIRDLKRAAIIVMRVRRMLNRRYRGLKLITIQVEIYAHTHSRQRQDSLHRVESDQSTTSTSMTTKTTTTIITTPGTIAACGSKMASSAVTPIDTLARHDQDIIFSIGDEDLDELDQQQEHHHRHRQDKSPLSQNATLQIHRAGTPLNQYRKNRLLSEDESESESEMEQEVQPFCQGEPNRWA